MREAARYYDARTNVHQILVYGDLMYFLLNEACLVTSASPSGKDEP